MLYEELGLQYEFYDPNPVNDNREHNDCLIRAFTKLVDKPWSKVYSELYKIGKKNGFMVNSNQTALDYAVKNGLDYCDDFCDDGSMFIAEFLSKIKNRNIACIIANSHHAFYFKDNIIYDTVDPKSGGEIDKKTKLLVDAEICEFVEYYIASSEDSDKILEILEEGE